MRSVLDAITEASSDEELQRMRDMANDDSGTLLDLMNRVESGRMELDQALEMAKTAVVPDRTHGENDPNAIAIVWLFEKLVVPEFARGTGQARIIGGGLEGSHMRIRMSVGQPTEIGFDLNLGDWPEVHAWHIDYGTEGAESRDWRNVFDVTDRESIHGLVVDFVRFLGR